ncbi:MAG TPA: ABC transporter permease [Candidatus Polarisedimenticolia bacterium]|nr:ABC transporter permease [Candidatus Polarisedimenticolia bacterium]
MSEETVDILKPDAGNQSNGSSNNPASPVAPSGFSPAQRAWRRFKKNHPAFLSAWYLALLLMVVAAWPIALKIIRSTGAHGAAWAKTYAPEELSDAQFQSPSLQHWFGTDEHGRDVLSRVLYGAQISLLVGFVGAAVSLVIGVLWGAIAGSAGGRTDSIMMRIVDVLYSLPSIIFVIVLITTLGQKLKQMPFVRHSPNIEHEVRLLILFVGLGAISWLTMARIVRGQVLSLRNRPFVDASRTLGASPVRILFRHIIPNVFGVVIVYLTLTVPSIVLYESFLSFLGLGVQPPMASWGSLISEGVDLINPIRVYWWMIVFPGGVLVSTLLALNFLGDGLRDAWDVKGN